MKSDQFEFVFGENGVIYDDVFKREREIARIAMEMENLLSREDCTAIEVAELEDRLVKFGPVIKQRFEKARMAFFERSRVTDDKFKKLSRVWDELKKDGLVQHENDAAGLGQTIFYLRVGGLPQGDVHLSKERGSLLVKFFDVKDYTDFTTIYTPVDRRQVYKDTSGVMFIHGIYVYNPAAKDHAKPLDKFIVMAVLCVDAAEDATVQQLNDREVDIIIRHETRHFFNKLVYGLFEPTEVRELILRSQIKPLELERWRVVKDEVLAYIADGTARLNKHQRSLPETMRHKDMHEMLKSPLYAHLFADMGRERTRYRAGLNEQEYCDRVLSSIQEELNKAWFKICCLSKDALVMLANYLVAIPLDLIPDALRALGRSFENDLDKTSLTAHVHFDLDELRYEIDDQNVFADSLQQQRQRVALREVAEELFRLKHAFNELIVKKFVSSDQDDLMIDLEFDLKLDNFNELLGKVDDLLGQLRRSK